MNYSEKGMIMDGFKWQGLSEKQEVDTEDRISGLPDAVLQHILSFLKTEDAVLTGILSRRWRYLWTGIPVLDFDDRRNPNRRITDSFTVNANHFMNLVERVLLLRDAINIKRFRLSCRVYFSASRIHSWISAAVKNKVQELDLSLLVRGLSLPHSVFSSESLTHLKLYMDGILQLPGHISFPRLKVLHLRRLTFENDKSMEKLFSCCPMLEELAMINCNWSVLKSITICIPSLRSLTIDDLSVFGPDDSKDCEIKIHATKLSSFVYCGYLTNDIQLSNLLASVKVSVHIPNAYRLRDKIAPRAVKLFEKVKNANSLRISNDTIEVNMLDHLPVFQQLTHLELAMSEKEHFGVTMCVKEHTLGSLIKFLKLLPKLEALNFAEGVGSHLCLYGDDGKSEPFTNCSLSCLKTVDLHNFNGNDSEICLLKTLLTSSPCLERINLFSFNSPSGKSKELGDLWNLLEEFPGGAKHCVVAIF